MNYFLKRVKCDWAEFLNVEVLSQRAEQFLFPSTAGFVFAVSH